MTAHEELTRTLLELAEAGHATPWAVVVPASGSGGRGEPYEGAAQGGGLSGGEAMTGGDLQAQHSRRGSGRQQLVDRVGDLVRVIFQDAYAVDVDAKMAHCDGGAAGEVAAPPSRGDDEALAVELVPGDHDRVRLAGASAGEREQGLTGQACTHGRAQARTAGAGSGPSGRRGADGVLNLWP